MSNTTNFGSAYNFFHNLPHITFKFQKISHDFDNSTPYWQSIIMISILFLVVAVVIWLLLASCLGFGCRRRAFRIKNHPEVEYYEEAHGHAVLSKVALLLLVIGFCACFVVSLIASAHAHHDIQQSADEYLEAGENICNHLDIIDLNLEIAINYFPEDLGPVKEAYQPYFSMLKNVYNTSETIIEDDIFHYETVRYQTVLSVFIVYAAIALILSLIVVFLGFKVFFVLLIIWFYFVPIFVVIIGVHMSGGTVLADFCSVSEEYLKTAIGNSPNEQVWADYYLNCIGTPPAQEVYDVLQNQTTVIEQYMDLAIAFNQTDYINNLTNVLNILYTTNNSLIVLNDCNVFHSTWVDVRQILCSHIFNDVRTFLVCLAVAVVCGIMAAMFTLDLCLGYKRETYRSWDMRDLRRKRVPQDDWN